MRNIIIIFFFGIQLNCICKWCVCVYIPYSSIEKQKGFCEKAKKLLLRALFLIKMMKKTNKTIYFSAPLEFKK